MVQQRVIEARASQVWDVLASGWLYPVFVVGAARMRAVDAGYPSPGTALHHSAGAWPLMIDDTTTVLECVPGRQLVLQARGWPAGEARISIVVEPLGPSRTSVTIAEDAVRGITTAVPGPLRRRFMDARNAETLLRLGHLAVGRAASS